jgi:GT2 family glycosyltransferase
MRVAAVTVNWNRAELTGQCLDSLVKSRPPPEWIIVVDNGSHEDPAPAVRAADPAAVILRHTSNLGYAAAANTGMARALALGADAVFLINNDAIAPPDCLSELAAALQRDTRLAGTGAKILTQEQPPRIQTAYGILTYDGWLARQRGWMDPNTDHFNEPADVDYICGCAMLLRREALEHVGLFDPEFFAYHEDLDWCARARQAGYRVAYIPSAVVYHRMHASTGGGYLSPITYLAQRNSILFVRKHASWFELFKYVVHLMADLVSEAVYRYRSGEVAGFKLRVRGLWDGLLRRPIPLRELGLELSDRPT